MGDAGIIFKNLELETTKEGKRTLGLFIVMLCIEKKNAFMAVRLAGFSPFHVDGGFSFRRDFLDVLRFVYAFVHRDAARQ